MIPIWNKMPEMILLMLYPGRDCRFVSPQYFGIRGLNNAVSPQITFLWTGKFKKQSVGIKNPPHSIAVQWYPALEETNRPLFLIRQQFKKQQQICFIFQLWFTMWDNFNPFASPRNWTSIISIYSELSSETNYTTCDKKKLLNKLTAG